MRGAPESADDKRIRFEGIVRRDWVALVAGAARHAHLADEALGLWRFIARSIARELWPGRVKPVAQRRGLKATLWNEPDPAEYLENWIGGVQVGALRELIVELLIDDVSYKPGPGPSALEMAAQLYGIERPTEAVAEYLEALEDSDE